MSTHDVDGLNAGYARALLDEYLENPEAVPSEWRALFESGDSELVATHPGLARLLEQLPLHAGNGTHGHTEAPPAPAPANRRASEREDRRATPASDPRTSYQSPHPQNAPFCRGHIILTENRGHFS